MIFVLAFKLSFFLKKSIFKIGSAITLSQLSKQPNDKDDVEYDEDFDDDINLKKSCRNDQCQHLTSVCVWLCVCGKKGRVGLSVCINEHWLHHIK